jgi:hypothetical protein
LVPFTDIFGAAVDALRTEEISSGCSWHGVLHAWVNFCDSSAHVRHAWAEGVQRSVATGVAGRQHTKWRLSDDYAQEIDTCKVLKSYQVT